MCWSLPVSEFGFVTVTWLTFHKLLSLLFFSVASLLVLLLSTVRESAGQVRLAEDALEEFDEKEVQQIKSHYACNIILSSAAAYYERLSKQGLISEREAGEFLEEIETEILHTKECLDDSHAGELSEHHKQAIGVKYRPKHCLEKTKKGDFISIHYNGTLYTNGNVFDSSILREYPFVFQLGKQTMIDGFEKGLLGMCVGEKRKLVVPSNMSYGEVGGFGSEASNKIKPNATLVYNVELLEIVTEEASAPDMVWGL